jgi:twinkle protein
MTNEELEAIKQVPILDVVGTFLDLKKKGSDYVACCPFHSEKTPSFTVRQNATESFFKCFGCGEKGDAIHFVQKYKNLSFVEATKVVAGIGNIFISEKADFGPKTRPTQSTKSHQQSQPQSQNTKQPIKAIENVKKVQTYQLPKIIQQQPSNEVISAFLKRGISEKVIREMKITQSMKYFSDLGKEAVSINFNYFKNGVLTNVKHRALEGKKFGLEKDCELLLYNLDNVQPISPKSKNIIITEGEFDALAVMEALGTCKNIISVPNGAGLSTQNMTYLDSENTKKILLGYKFILCFDNDQAGKNLTDAFIKRFGEQNCYIVSYPDECKDMNDVLLKHGSEAVKWVIENKRFTKVNGILDVIDFENVIDTYYENGYPTTDKIGIDSIDELISFRGGELTMVTGISGSGKSEFLDFLMVRLADRCGWKFGVCSMEAPPAIHFTNISSKYIGKPFRPIISRHGEVLVEQMSQEEHLSAKHFVYQNFKFITNTVSEDEDRNRGVVDVDYIINQAKKLKAMYGIKGLVIDPWNTIEHIFRTGENETNYVSRVLSKIIAFAEDFDVHVFLVAHPTKGVTRDGIDRVATLNDISGSGNFFNKTYNGISVFRDKDKDRNPQNLVEVHVQKIKFKFVGNLGVATLKYNRTSGNYEDAPAQLLND